MRPHAAHAGRVQFRARLAPVEVIRSLGLRIDPINDQRLSSGGGRAYAVGGNLQRFAVGRVSEVLLGQIPAPHGHEIAAQLTQHAGKRRPVNLSFVGDVGDEPADGARPPIAPCSAPRGLVNAGVRWRLSAHFPRPIAYPWPA